MPLIDSHAHLDFNDFDDDLQNVIERAKLADVAKIINVGADLARSQKAIEIAEKFDNVWATVGIHPEDVDVDLHKAKKKIIKLVNSSKKVVAIGECGFDYFHSGSKTEEQKTLFQLQIDISREFDLPLVIHIRNSHDNSAAEDGYKILKENMVERGVIHCFTLGKEWAKKYLDLGFHLGFTGIVTYKNATLVSESAHVTPLNRILVETDSPYLAPQKYRGQRNEPSYETEVAQKIADIKEITYSSVAAETTKNAEGLFKI
ncbi:MAG: TatD family hydrolase [bacterium]